MEAATPLAVARPPAESPGITKEEALALVRRYFKIPDGPGSLEVRLETEGNRPVWQFTYWIDRENGRYGRQIGVMDAITGRIRQFSLEDRMLRRPQTGPLGAPHTVEEARERAWALVRELYPEAASTLRPAPEALATPDPFLEGDSYTYTFEWMEYHNGVPVPSSAVRVSVDRYTLDYISLLANLLENPVYVEGSAALSTEEALARFREAAVPQLRYQLIYPSYPYQIEGDPQVRLLYQVTTPAFIDAVTGEFVNFPGQAVLDSPAEAVPAGSEPQRAVSFPLAPGDAVAVVRDLLGLPEDAEIQILDLSDDTGREASYHLYWHDEEGSASVSLNGKTGLVEYAYRSVPVSQNAPDPGQAEPTEEQLAQAREEAIRVVQRHFGSLVPSLRLEPGVTLLVSGEGISFHFQRYEHGVPFSHDGVDVITDPATGQWTRINAYWQEGVDLAPPEGVIGPEAAVEAFFADRTAQLVYWPKAEPWSIRSWRLSEPVELMLVYRHLSQDPAWYSVYGLDAVTGEPVGVLTAARSREAVDELISGHWAEGELRFLLDSFWIQPSDLNPEGEVSRLKALSLLLSVYTEIVGYMSGRSVAVPYVDAPESEGMRERLREAIMLGILRPEGEAPRLDGDAPITRAEFALWIARALGLGDLARSGLRTISGFADLEGLSPEHRNAIAFLEALGLVSSGAAFRGEDALTQAEAAAMAVRLLLHLQKAK